MDGASFKAADAGSGWPFISYLLTDQINTINLNSNFDFSSSKTRI